jgi:hypothetical protein
MPMSESGELAMINRHAQRELFGGPRKLGQNPKAARVKYKRHIPLRQVLIAMLLGVIVTSWLLDSFHIRFVPETWHTAVAGYTDQYMYQFQSSKAFVALCQAVGHNPIDDSPITLGSVLALGAIVGVWLGVSKGTAIFKEEC